MFMGVGAVALLVMFMSKKNGGGVDTDVEMMDLPPAGGGRPTLPIVVGKRKRGELTVIGTPSPAPAPFPLQDPAKKAKTVQPTDHERFRAEIDHAIQLFQAEFEIYMNFRYKFIEFTGLYSTRGGANVFPLNQTSTTQLNRLITMDQELKMTISKEDPRNGTRYSGLLGNRTYLTEREMADMEETYQKLKEDLIKWAQIRAVDKDTNTDLFSTKIHILQAQQTVDQQCSERYCASADPHGVGRPEARQTRRVPPIATLPRQRAGPGRRKHGP